MKRSRSKAKLLTVEYILEARSLKEFESVLGMIGNLNEKSKIKGETVLHTVAEAGNLDFVKYLLERGADINVKNNVGYTALHLAALKGHLDVVKYLLEKGVDIEAINDRGETALHVTSDPDVVKYLLENKADIEASDEDGYTALHWAAEYGNVEVVNCLLENKADIEATDNYGDTALHHAAQEGYLNVVECLLNNKANIKTRNGHESTVLHCAAQNGHPDVVKYLLDKGADINAIDIHKDTALHVAAFFGRLDVVNVVKCLLDKGANIEAINDRGKTALHEAAQERNLNVVKCLLSYKARICPESFKEIKGRFSYWHKKIIKTLLIRAKKLIEGISDWDTVLEDWQVCAPVFRLSVLSQACLETGRPVQSIEFQKEIFYHEDSTEEEQGNAANLITMSLLGSSPEASDYIKALEYAVFEKQALAVVMRHFHEQINMKNYDVINKILTHYSCNEINDKFKLKLLEILFKLNNLKIEAEEQIDHNTTSMLP